MPVIGFLQRRVTRPVRALRRGIPAGPERSRLYRRPERGDRIPLGGGPIRPTAGVGGRSGSPPGGRDRRASGPPAALAAKAQPRRFRSSSCLGGDPVELGFVASLNRPGGNVTGVSLFTTSWWQSGWSCCTSWCPTPPCIAVLVNPTLCCGQSALRDMQAAARQPWAYSSRSCRAPAATGEIEAAFATFVQLRDWRAHGRLRSVLHQPRDQIVALAARHAVPAIYRHA